MRSLLHVIFFVIFLFLTSYSIFAQQIIFPNTVQPYNFTSARMDALGGVHAGIADDFYTTLFVNPAGLADVEVQKNYASLGINLNNAELIIKLARGDNMMPELLDIVSNSFTSYLNLCGPFAIGRVGNNWGIGFFTTSRINLIWRPENVFMIEPILTEELLLKGGYGFRILDSSKYKFDAGLLTKVFIRAGYNGPDVFANEVKNILDKIPEWPIETQMGLGFDAGVRLTIYDSLILGAAVYDLFSPVNVTIYRNFDRITTLTQMDNRWIPVQPTATAGLTWKVKSDFLHRFVDDLSFSADFQGVLGNTRIPMRNPLLDLSAGLEVRVLEVLSLRAKWSEMLPGGGIGVHLPLAQFDASFCGNELGTEPWQLPTYAFTIQFLWRR
ncbi:MAG: hypothetical protein Ta2B_28770 [Termitinemataceae bacterium]|nr:MAG: hypothetical protein Ta2B_28770 [Termitinemataceae bacterium]